MQSSQAQTKATLLLVVCTLVGAGAGFALMPLLFPLARTELSRTAVLLNALRSGAAVPPIVVLGDSAVMAGVDARQLSLLRGRVEAWNLGSTGQELSETLLLIDALPDSVKTVVVGVHLDKLTKPTVAMPRNKYVAYVMGGYRPSADVMDISVQLQDAALHDLLESNRLRVVTWSRWVVRAMADLSIRRALRDDLDLERARTDLYHPAPYSRAVDAVAVDRLVRLTYGARAGRFVARPDAVALLKGMDRMLARRGKRVIFVVLPEHPLRRAMTTGSYYAGVERWVVGMRNAGLEIIDLHDVLDAGDFIDHVHPGDRGAARLTYLISRTLRSHGA